MSDVLVPRVKIRYQSPFEDSSHFNGNHDLTGTTHRTVSVPFRGFVSFQQFISQIKEEKMKSINPLSRIRLISTPHIQIPKLGGGEGINPLSRIRLISTLPRLSSRRNHLTTCINPLSRFGIVETLGRGHRDDADDHRVSIPFRGLVSLKRNSSGLIPRLPIRINPLSRIHFISTTARTSSRFGVRQQCINPLSRIHRVSLAPRLSPPAASVPSLASSCSPCRRRTRNRQAGAACARARGRD